MSNEKERSRVLQSLESEFINDLSLHLYSSFLLHRINPNFPLTRWSSWPKKFDKVPVPSQKYEDDLINGNEERYEWDIDEGHVLYERDRTWQMQGIKRQRKKKRKDRNRGDNAEPAQQGKESSSTSQSEETSSEIDDAGSSDTNNDSLHSEDGDDEVERNEEQLLDSSNKIVEVTYTERVPQAKVSLMNSINSLLELKIRTKIQQMRQQGKIDSSMTMTSDAFPKYMLLVSELANRFNSMLDTIFDTFHINDYPLTWQNVLLAGIINDRQRGQLNPQLYQKLLHNCEEIFENVHNVYEFDNDEAKEEAIRDGIVTDDGGFNVEKYLYSLRDEYVGPGQKVYEALAKNYMRDFNNKVNFQSRLKQNMLNMIGEEGNKRKRKNDEVEHSDEELLLSSSHEERNQPESDFEQRHHRLLQQQKELQESYTIKF